MSHPSSCGSKHCFVTRALVASLALSLGPSAVAATDCYDVLDISSTRDHIFALCEAAENGDLGAMYWLGVAFIEGAVVSDYDQGISWLKRASFAGNAYAQRLYEFISSAEIGPGC